MTSLEMLITESRREDEQNILSGAFLKPDYGNTLNDYIIYEFVELDYPMEWLLSDIRIYNLFEVIFKIYSKVTYTQLYKIALVDGEYHINDIIDYSDEYTTWLDDLESVKSSIYNQNQIILKFIGRVKCLSVAGGWCGETILDKQKFKIVHIENKNDCKIITCIKDI